MGRTTIPAPLGGVNFQSGIANVQMPEAVQLDNWIARPACVESRGGTIVRNQGEMNNFPIRTLAPHPNGWMVIGTEDKLYPYDTNTNTLSLFTSGFTESRWNFTLFNDLVILCNGADTPQAYPGAFTFTPLVITGVTSSTLWGCQTFKGRVYYWQRDKQEFWYAAAGAYQGALSRYDLSAFTIKDGYLLALVPLTIDGGAGPDDLAAFVFSTGEVLLFQGDDPGSATAWQQIGRFYIPNPIGPQSWLITGSASIVGTVIGAVDLARALAVGPYDVSAVIGQQVTGTAVNALPTPIVHSQMLVVPNDNIIWWARYAEDSFNSGSDIQTLAMDLTAKRWSRFTNLTELAGMGTTCVGVCNGRLFLGDDLGDLHEYSLTDTGDSVATDGGPIRTQFTTVQAYTDFGAPTNRKKITAVSPVTECDAAATGTTAITFGFNEDYVPNTTNLTNTINIPDASGVHSENFSRVCANGFRLGLTWSITAPAGGTGRYRWIATDVILKTGGEQ